MELHQTRREKEKDEPRFVVPDDKDIDKSSLFQTLEQHDVKI